MLWMDFWTSVHEVGSCTKWWGTVVRIDSSIDSIDILRFWHRFLSIPLIRYFRQAWWMLRSARPPGKLYSHCGRMGHILIWTLAHIINKQANAWLGIHQG